MKHGIFSLLILMIVVSLAFGGDTYNQTATREVYPTGVLFSGTVDMTSDSVGNFYTQALKIVNCNQKHAMFWGKCSNVTGTEDVNVFVEYSPDRTNWLLSSNASGKIVDSLSITFSVDTVDVVNAVQDYVHPSAKWMRFKFDGQTSNPLTTVSWWVWCPFNDNLKSDWPLHWQEKYIFAIMNRGT